MPLSPNHRLDHYILTEIIGEGGMGAVWKARDTTLDRDVAIKVLPPEFSANPERLARFEREAKAVAALSHPNIVAIHGFGTHEGNAYAAIELLEGRALDQHLEEGPLPPRKALEIARQVATGLAAAHAKGIVHRDLKPGNVFLSPDGRARILDFGLAAVADPSGHVATTEQATRTSLTNPGAIMGTANYMSPEQVLGAPADSSADIFALGAMLHEMLTGQKPFERPTAAETMTAVLREDAPVVTLAGKPAPPAIAGLISRCLEKSPDERFQSARDLAFALGNASTSSGSNEPVTEGLARTKGRNIWGKVGMLVAAVLLFAAGSLTQRTPPSPEPPRITQLTFSGTDHQPSVSPNGRLIAFTSSRTGASRIWLRQVRAGGEHPLTEGPDWRPSFSADGTTVIFIRGDGKSYAAYRVPVVGGQPRKLIDDVTAVEWSPDGRQLAFVRVPEAVDGNYARSEVGLFDVESGQQRIVHTQANKLLFGLGWSPDGTRLSITQSSIQSVGSSLIILDPASGAVEEVTIGDSAGLISGATWADASSLIVAVSESAVNASALPNRVVRHDLRSGRRQTLFWAAHLFPFQGSVTWTTRLAMLDETSLVFDSAQRRQSLHEIDIKGEAVRELLGSISVDRQPAYHPDGSAMLFTSSRSGNVDLFSYEFATGELLQLTDHPASDWDGAYTPDGTSILWSSERSGNLEIWTAALDGSNPRQITRDGVSAENPTMTADGEWILYTSGNPEHPGIARIRADGSDLQQLATGDSWNCEVSPDGRFAFYLRTDEAAMRSVGEVVDLSSGEMTPFTFEVIYTLQSPNVSYGRARWMPDGSAIAYVGVDEQGRTGLWVQDFSTERDTVATRRRLIGFDGSGVHESFGISPDGKRILVSTLEQVRAIHMVEGLPEL